MMRKTSVAVGLLAALLVLAGCAVHHTAEAPSTPTLLYLHIASWLAQFWGHGVSLVLRREDSKFSYIASYQSRQIFAQHGVHIN